MEIIAQWFDDLEDLIFALPLAWERLRDWCLQIGLIATLVLAVLQIWPVVTVWTLTFAGVALASVGAWIAGLAVSEIVNLRRQAIGTDTPPNA